MIRKILLLSISIFLLFNLFIVSAKSSTSIELFDIEKNEVIKVIPTNPEIQLEIKKIINEVDNIVKKLKPIPDKGFMIKIPLEPSLLLDNHWVYAQIDEVIIIIPKEEKPVIQEDEKPYILIFDDDNMPHFLTLKTKIDTLLNNLDFTF